MNTIRICTRNIPKPLARGYGQSFNKSNNVIRNNNRVLHKISKRFAGGEYDFDHAPPGYSLREWRFWHNYATNWGPTTIGTIAACWWIYRLYTWRDEFFGHGMLVWLEPYWP